MQQGKMAEIYGKIPRRRKAKKKMTEKNKKKPKINEPGTFLRFRATATAVSFLSTRYTSHSATHNDEGERNGTSEMRNKRHITLRITVFYKPTAYLETNKQPELQDAQKNCKSRRQPVLCCLCRPWWPDCGHLS